MYTWGRDEATGLWHFSLGLFKQTPDNGGALGQHSPIPAWPTIHDMRMKSITPQMFNIQRTCRKKAHLTLTATKHQIDPHHSSHTLYTIFKQFSLSTMLALHEINSFGHIIKLKGRFVQGLWQRRWGCHMSKQRQQDHFQTSFNKNRHLWLWNVSFLTHTMPEIFTSSPAWGDKLKFWCTRHKNVRFLSFSFRLYRFKDIG